MLVQEPSLVVVLMPSTFPPSPYFIGCLSHVITAARVLVTAAIGQVQTLLILRVQFKVCHGSLYDVMWLADEPREFNLPTFPQRRMTYVPEKLPGKYGVHSEEYLRIRTVTPVVAGIALRSESSSGRLNGAALMPDHGIDDDDDDDDGGDDDDDDDMAKTDQPAAGLTPKYRSTGGRSSNQNGETDFANSCKEICSQLALDVRKELFDVNNDKRAKTAQLQKTDGYHVWADENSHALDEIRHQHRFSINVWAGVLSDRLRAILATTEINWGSLSEFSNKCIAYLVKVVVITEDVQNVHLLLEYRPHIDVSLTCEHDPKLQEYCVCPQNMPQFDSEAIPNQAPETNKPIILNGPTTRNREGSDQVSVEAK
ncbi:hypothetical protein ANN_13845 [Periplaneta americana]|uniref:Uncharacterized protein n=1 Tax=Periplaneta americana TaxID=6978 RepID=A0ABQ8SUN0_PERAM|nr:hypothetical protein ANN_13845 [Periplaneta americana]